MIPRVYVCVCFGTTPYGCLCNRSRTTAHRPFVWYYVCKSLLGGYKLWMGWWRRYWRRKYTTNQPSLLFFCPQPLTPKAMTYVWSNHLLRTTATVTKHQRATLFARLLTCVCTHTYLVLYLFFAPTNRVFYENRLGW